MSETKLTTSIMVTVSGSTKKPTSRCKPPGIPTAEATCAQVYTEPLMVWWSNTTDWKRIADTTVATSTPRIVTTCAPDRPSVRPKSPAAIAPARGASGTSRQSLRIALTPAP
jgi:hypothetical protein